MPRSGPTSTSDTYAYSGFLLMFGARRLFVTHWVRGWKKVVCWPVTVYVVAPPGSRSLSLDE